MIWMLDLEVLEHAENVRDVEVMQFYSERMDSRKYEFGPVLEFKVAHRVYKCGIEIGVTSLKNGGSQSWIVISRGVNKHVDELPEENGTSIHFEEVTTGTGRNNRLHNYLHCRRCQCRSIDGSGKTFLPSSTSLRGYLTLTVSKTMTRILRHRGFHREDDGAMDWDTWLHMLCRDCENAPRWMNDEWLDLLHEGSDKDFSIA